MARFSLINHFFCNNCGSKFEKCSENNSNSEIESDKGTTVLYPETEVLTKNEMDFKSEKNESFEINSANYKGQGSKNHHSVIIIIAIMLVLSILCGFIIIKAAKSKNDLINAETNNISQNITPELTSESDIYSATEGTTEYDSGEITSERQVNILSVTNDDKMTSNDCTVSYDGYYGECFLEEDNETYIISESGLYIYGSLDYDSNLDLSDYEGHGGDIYYENGDVLDDEDLYGIYAGKNFDKVPSEYHLTFWSDQKERKFVIGIPDSIKPGKYILEIYQFFSDEMSSFEIIIEVC